MAALKEFPHFNSSYDMNAGELVTKKYFHVGIAVDTERGLVVPVIRDADKKTIRDLADGSGRAGREGSHRQAGGGRDAGRQLHHHEPGRHRRYRLHPDRQLPGGSDSRAEQVEPASRSCGTVRSSRG